MPMYELLIFMYETVGHSANESSSCKWNISQV